MIILHIWNQFIGFNFSEVAVGIIFMLYPTFVNIFPLCTHISQSFIFPQKAVNTPMHRNSLFLRSSNRSGLDQEDLCRQPPAFLYHWSSQVLEKGEVL